MPRIVTTICLFALLFTYTFGNENERIKLHHPNYFVFGDEDDQVKFRVSMKYNLIYPFSSGLWFAYTQKAFWKLYEKSAPFWEFNHEPEIFWHFESKNNLFGINTGPIDYISISPIYHRSNGKDRAESRSMNCYYAELQISFGERILWGTRSKVFQYYNVSSKNRDIADYIGNYEGMIFIQFREPLFNWIDREKMYIQYGGNPKTKKGWIEGGVQLRLFTVHFQPMLYFQLFYGYGEAMVKYNQKDIAFRFGFVFE